MHNIPLNENMANIVQVLQMCHAFQQIGIDVTLAIPTAPEQNSESKMREIIQQKTGKSPAFEVRRLPSFTIAGRLKAIGTYSGIKSLLKYNDNIDFWFTRVSFIAHLAITQDIKTIYELHDAKVNNKSKLMDSIYCRYLLRDAYSPRLVLFVTISNALAKIWQRRGIPAEKVLTLHDGFSAEDYETVTSRKQARQMLGINTDNKIVVYAGSLYKDRGIEDILRLAKAFSNVGFYVIGGPEKNRRYYEGISIRERLNNVFFTGCVPHCKVKDYLFAADVLLMLWTNNVPTINICSPLKAFEYMAAERIIVGYGFPTIREVLKDGESALLAVPDSYEDLERKLGYALSLNYPSDMAQKARKIAYDKYSWEKRAKAIVRVLH